VLPQFHATVADLARKGRYILLIIDEGHLLPPELFDQLRFLLNQEMDSASAITLVLLGQPELAHKLRFAPYEALYQRIAVRYQIPPFDLEETAGYIKHHLRVADWQGPLFSDSFVGGVHDHTKGVSRCASKRAGSTISAAARCCWAPPNANSSWMRPTSSESSSIWKGGWPEGAVPAAAADAFRSRLRVGGPERFGRGCAYAATLITAVLSVFERPCWASFFVLPACSSILAVGRSNTVARNSSDSSHNSACWFSLHHDWILSANSSSPPPRFLFVRVPWCDFQTCWRKILTTRRTPADHAPHTIRRGDVAI